MLSEATFEDDGGASGPAIADGSATAYGPTVRSRGFTRRYGKFSGLRAFVLLGGDLSAFFFSFVLAAAIMAVGVTSAVPNAYDRVQALGVAWHGWETLLVLAVLLSHLAGRGHYTQRVPFWAEFGDLLRSTGIAFLFDFVLATKIDRLGS